MSRLHIRQNVNRTKPNEKFANKACSQHSNRPFRILNLITLWDQSHCAPPKDFLGTFCDRKTENVRCLLPYFRIFRFNNNERVILSIVTLLCSRPLPQRNADWPFVVIVLDVGTEIWHLYIGQLWLWRMWQSAKNLTCPFD